MTFTPTEKLLLACAGTRMDKDRIETLLRQKIDGQSLLKTARMHQLTPLLFHNLKEMEIPEEIIKALKDGYILTLIANLKREAEQKRIFELLTENGIDFVPLKGLILAKRYYGDIALRPTTDVDFLVKRKDVIKVRDLLVLIGYKSGGNYGEEYYLKAHYHLFLSKTSKEGKGGYAVEVHWNLMLSDLIVIDPNNFWENTTHIELDQQQIKVLQPEIDLFHAFLSFYYDPIPSLKCLVDFVEILQSSRQGINWEVFNDLIKIYKLDAPLQLCLRFASECLGSREPFKYIRARRVFFLQRALINLLPLEWIIRKKHLGMIYLAKLVLFGNLKTIISHVRYYFFPREEKMTTLCGAKKERRRINLFDYLVHIGKMIKMSLG